MLLMSPCTEELFSTRNCPPPLKEGPLFKTVIQMNYFGSTFSVIMILFTHFDGLPALHLETFQQLSRFS